MTLDPLPALEMRELVEPAVQRAVDRAWSLDDLDWSGLRPDELTEDDRSVVRFITYIEDHIPGYLTWLLDRFPTTGDDLELAEVCVNREYFRFLIAWANDEERHAAALTRYQISAGMAEPAALLADLAEEGRKPFALPYTDPLQAFTYTLVQEKATQLFYQRFHDAATEPLLRDLLTRLARDEARHFSLYSHLVAAYLKRDGVRALPDLKEVLHTFRMPLADTLDNYWRWALRVGDAVGYRHTDAYLSLGRLVDQFVDRPGSAEVDDVRHLVLDLTRLP